MNIHAISTGEVKITRNWRIGRGSDSLRLVNALLDTQYTDWLPIYVWVVEHPEGLIVVDTGIPANANDPIYFPPYMPLIQRAAKFKITPEQMIDTQMRALGLSPEDVRWVIQTHLHQDHEGRFDAFPNAEFVVSRTEWMAAQGLKGRLGGYLNQRWSRWLDPTLIDFAGDETGFFRGKFVLTQAKDVRLVSTPGHSAGHLSVIVREGDHEVFIAGDASYTQALLIANSVDGVATDPAAERDSQQRIVSYAAHTPIVYLPSHDPDSARRLAEREIIPMKRELAPEGVFA